MLAQADDILDGIELDWQRHAFHLPTELAYRLRYVITDVQRTVRAMCNEVAERRGRPLLLTARVAGSVAQSKRQGYDVEAWLEEDLVDVLTPAGNAATDDGIDVREWKELAARCGSGVAICPGTDSGIPRMTSTPEQAHIGPEPPPINETLKSRGLGARYLGAGADGLYVFNFLQDNQVNVSMADGSYRYNTELLTELGRSVIHSLCRLSARLASRDSRLYGAWVWVWLRAGRLLCIAPAPSTSRDWISSTWPPIA
jgi:hypothetical protein